MKILNTFTPYYYTGYASKKKNVSEAPAFKAYSNSITSSIRGQKNCWKLHDPKIFEQFIRADDALKSLAEPVLKICESYMIPPTVNIFIRFKEKKEELKSFFDMVKSKYEIDLEVPPTVYRFIGKTELDELRAGRKVLPQRNDMGRFDVTIDPYLNWNEFRIAFKPASKFSILDSMSSMRENPGACHEYFYHFLDGYSLDDVEEIKLVRK